MDPNNPIITLPDGTTAQIQGVASVSHNDDAVAAGLDQDQQQQLADRNQHLIKSLIWQFVPTSQITGVTSSDGVTTLTNAADGTTVTTVDLTAVTESTIGQEGQHHILLTGEDGQSKLLSLTLKIVFIRAHHLHFLLFYFTSLSSQCLRNDHRPCHVPSCGCQYFTDSGSD